MVDQHPQVAQERGVPRQGAVGADVAFSGPVAPVDRFGGGDDGGDRGDAPRRGGVRRVNHAIVVAAPLRTVALDLPVPPYTLGAWLGDGTTSGGSISKPDDEVFANIEADGFEISRKADPMTRTPLGLMVMLREAGVLGDTRMAMARRLA